MGGGGAITIMNNYDFLQIGGKPPQNLQLTWLIAYDKFKPNPLPHLKSNHFPPSAFLVPDTYLHNVSAKDFPHRITLEMYEGYNLSIHQQGALTKKMMAHFVAWSTA